MNDTVMLLRECNAGIKMGNDAINQVLPHVKSYNLKKALNACLDEQAALGDKTHKLLIENGADTKNAHPVAKMMSDMKIKSKLLMDPAESTVADLMTDGCDMGIKSLTKQLNKYKDASDEARAVAEDVIAAEERLECQLRDYL